MQQDDRHATGLLVGEPQAGHGDFDAGVGAIGGLDSIHVFTQVAATLGTEQGDREKITTALHKASCTGKLEVRNACSSRPCRSMACQR